MLKEKSGYILSCLFFVLFLFNQNPVFAQYNPDLLSISKMMKNANPDTAYKKLQQLEKKGFSKADYALYYKVLSDFYQRKNVDDDKAYKMLLESQKRYKAIDSIDACMEIDHQIFNVLFYGVGGNTDPLQYAERYYKYAQEVKNPTYMATSSMMLADYYFLESENFQLALKYYRDALKYNSQSGNRDQLLVIRSNLSVLFSEGLKQPDSSLYYLKLDLDYIEQTGNVYKLSSNYGNQAAAYFHKNDFAKAIEYSKKSQNILPDTPEAWQPRYNNELIISDFYEKNGDYKNALNSIKEAAKLRDSLNAQEKSIAISEIETKYKTKEKELENTILKGNIKSNRVILILVITASAFVILLISFLLINSKRKEKIERQQKIIEQQKFEKALTEYELSRIDIMLEGQERERERIANDLHDNLGSMLATLRLNFENLKMRVVGMNETNERLFDTNEKLIEEAYHKVRRLAHTKNAGVLASESLIPSVEKLAAKISIPDKISVQVFTNITEKLDLKLEIAIFRMIQELSTNVIKHSQASEATIQITNHDDTINIMIEDNGIGFDPAKLNTDGMGLSTLKKKVEQLHGTFEIDSTIGKGSTFIIELPI